MRLKEIRTQKGYSIAKLSQISGIHRRTIEDIEKANNCTVASAKKLAKVLDVTLDQLCADSESNLN